MSKTSRDNVNDFYRKLFVVQPSRSWTVTSIVTMKKQKIENVEQSNNLEPPLLQEMAFCGYYLTNAIAFQFFNRKNTNNEKEGRDAAKAAAKKVQLTLSFIPILPLMTLVSMALALVIALIASVIYPFALLGAALKSDKTTDTSDDMPSIGNNDL